MIILSVGKIKRIILVLLIFLLLYTRLVGLDWGLPYPFHPDERNMAIAVEQLSCDSLSDLENCLNPHFYAYGQFPLYLGYGVVHVMKFFDGDLRTPIGFQEATLALRIISAFASILLAYFMVRIVQILLSKRPKRHSRLDRESRNRQSGLSRFWINQNDTTALITLLIVTFSPALIQFAHFGTTESLLMLFYTWLIYEALLLLNKKISLKHFLITSSIITGLALATKVSAFIFTLVPLVVSLTVLKKNLGKALGVLFLYGVIALAVGIIFSPHNLISFNEFRGALRYESAVAFDTAAVFYTRQFAGTIPILFQFTKVFPYVLGWPVLTLFVLGLFLLPLNKQYNFLRFSFLVYFLPNAFFFAKWARFMAPITPVMIVVAILFLFVILNSIEDLLNKIRFPIKSGMTVLGIITSLVIILPGLAYLSIYQHLDVRVQASQWINKNIPAKSHILSETANVVDIPVENVNGLRVISFNFYDLDTEETLQEDLQQTLSQADYIFVPSRRLFANHQNSRYPQLDDYYTKLFSGELGFDKVAEFSYYPKISYLGKTLLEFPDESAEETWTVFDHPVIRIYKRK